ncbi:ClbS/DfsB family four-helix bundle protein [Lactiplantibacillus plantarum]|uniref:ClbS/DfsB family four-helix bundle protein n=1 Tax=Lactiplantibacillus plantarum TaxID=1590 RepID=UPI003AFAEAEC
MARPTTKKDLIESSNEQYETLFILLKSIPQKDLTRKFSFDISKEKQAHWRRDKNIRDVLIHVYEWHKLMLNWVNNNLAGSESSFFPEGYNWRNYGKLNQIFFDQHQKTSLDEAINLLEESHTKIMSLINTFTNEELFSKGTYEWVGGTTLGSYFVSCTVSHYNWAIKKIKKHKQTI